MKYFKYNEVTLEDGMLKDKFDETLEFYLRIPNDNIMKYMRERAGKPAPGIYYTGWYVNSGGIALIGQWLSAFSRMYAITSNEAFREKAIFLAEEFWSCYEAAKETNPFLTSRSYYAYEKLLMAHCDLYTYCQYDKAKEHASYLIDFASNLTTENIFGDNSTEWYTLTESFLTAYEIFHIDKAKTYAEKFEYREFWDLFYKNADPFSKRPEAGLYSEFCHAYSHLNSFNGCAKTYELTKNPYYLKALRSFYDFMQAEEVMATGGYGPNFEHLMPKDRIIDALRTGHDSFETQCDTYAVFRLVKYLTSFTGEAYLGNWVESLLYNAVVATIPMTDEGNIIYYSDYNMYGAKKVNRIDGWTCCTGTRPLLITEMQSLIYFEENNDLYVSQYTPSSLRWNRCDQEITVKQTTKFPLEDTTNITLSLTTPTCFSIHLRMPGWLSDSMTVYRNGAPMETTVDKNGWLTISATWNDGDSLSVALPQNIWMHSLDEVKQGPNAFLHGPVVLAADYSGIQTPQDWMDIKNIIEKMQPVEGKPLHYTVEGIDTIYFQPFYEFKENERYFLYHDTTAHASKFY